MVNARDRLADRKVACSQVREPVLVGERGGIARIRGDPHLVEQFIRGRYCRLRGRLSCRTGALLRKNRTRCQRNQTDHQAHAGQPGPRRTRAATAARATAASAAQQRAELVRQLADDFIEIGRSLIAATATPGITVAASWFIPRHLVPQN